MPVSIGPRIKVDGEEDYRRQINDIIQQSKTLDAELKAMAAAFDENATAEEKARASTANLNEQLELAHKRTQLVRGMTAEATAAYEEDSREVQLWRQALAAAKEEEAKLERAVQENTRALEGEGEAADDTGDEIADLGKKTDDASDKTSVFASVLKADLVHDALSAALDGLKQLGEMAIDFGKTVIESYGELEQNLGGSQAVFGEYAETVQRAAEQSYKTLGASESEYLAAANKMGALFQGSGVDVQRSMELTTQAIQRAADVASVMGVDTSAAMEAVTGAAKGNYTMMDNLGVKMDATTLKAYALSEGMSKTWEEMSNAEKAELSMKYFFEQTEKYAGNFEEEARTTISGSIGMLQASVESWVAGLGNSEADIGTLTGNVIDSFETVVENVVPIVENVIQSMPQIYDSVMSAVEKRSPQLADSLRNFAEPLGRLMESLGKLGESLAPTAAGAIKLLGDAFSGIIGFIASAADALANFVDWLERADQEWDIGDDVGYYGGYNPALPGNAAGDTNWRGGLTWVGEQGPELVSLPQGSRIYSNPESERLAAAGTDTSRMEALLERSVAIMQRISDDLDDLEAVRRMA